MPREFTAWESHNLSVANQPRGFEVIAYSDAVPVEAMANERIDRFGVQFHPEVRHTEHGLTIMKNFLDLCQRK